MIEDRAAVASDVQIGVAVVVVVADSNALAVVPFSSNAGLLRDVGKRSVAIIVVQGGAQSLRWFVNVGGG